jgi:nitrogen fixation protein FixH
MKHDVHFSIPARELGKSDISFDVRGDGEIIGRLEVSKGSLVWYPKNNRYGHKITWAQFARVMEDYPRHERRK